MPDGYTCISHSALVPYGHEAISVTQSFTSSRKISQELKQDTKLMNLLRGAVAGAKNEDGWSRLSVVGSQIANQASFEPRNYGYAKLSSMFEAIDLFEIRRKDKKIYIKTKKKR